MGQPEEQVGVDLRPGLEWKTFLERGRLGGVTHNEIEGWHIVRGCNSCNTIHTTSFQMLTLTLHVPSARFS